MTDPGLNDRLRQKSRRAGLAVGLTMALAIAICVGGGIAIYASLLQPLSDLIPVQIPASALTPGISGEAQGAPLSGSGAASDGGTGDQQAFQVQATATVIAAETPEPTAAPSPTPAPFKPTHQIEANESVNLRTGPSINDQIIRSLQIATPLQYLDEDATGPDDGQRWMRFKTESGEEGWIREQLVAAYRP